ncbi:MAG: CPBP family intramembrane glutamic endopeptidase [Sandaracinaceae bacterium]
MRALLMLFWNPEERRLRAALRLLAVLLLTVLFVLPGGIAHYFLRPILDPAAAPAGFALFASWQAGAVLAAVAIGARFLDRRPLADMGLHVRKRSYAHDFGFDFALSGALIGAILAVEVGFGLSSVRVADPSWEGMPRAALTPVALVLFAGVSFNEELLFRGALLTNAAEGFTSRLWSRPTAWALATVVSSVVFGAAHMGNPDATAVSTSNIALAGVFLATGYLVTGELALPLGLHLSWNWIQAVFGMPVSGNDFDWCAALVREVHGPVWLTGGDFGPEAGVTGLVAIVVGTLAIYGWARWTRGPLRVRAGR